jgi:hypothetical protein
VQTLPLGLVDQRHLDGLLGGVEQRDRLVDAGRRSSTRDHAVAFGDHVDVVVHLAPRAVSARTLGCAGTVGASEARVILPPRCSWGAASRGR